MKILDGKVFAAQLKESLSEEISSLKSKHHKSPRLVSILFGDDPSAISYSISQQKAAESLGMEYELKKVPIDIAEDIFENGIINPLNKDDSVSGIFLNKPIPTQLNALFVRYPIDPQKDVEGLSPLNLADLFLSKPQTVPCTAAAALALLKSSGVSLQGKTAVVLGRSEIVGKPIALLLLQENMTVTICHSKTVDLKHHLSQADVVIAAIGKPLFVKGDWIKQGAIIIDVGINQVDGKIVGDVDFDSCKDNASFITPVPGGVGPVTSVMLMKNVVEAFKKSL
jgi:methylenetetrahydrofolate dehydrogenase (NADP+)/methenyltetrahydrofolate cyclohydrolase